MSKFFCDQRNAFFVLLIQTITFTGLFKLKAKFVTHFPIQITEQNMVVNPQMCLNFVDW